MRLDFRMPNQRLLNLIEVRAKELKRSLRNISIKATGKPDAIRVLKRGAKPKAETLRKLAKELGLPAQDLYDAAAPEMEDVPIPAAESEIERRAREVALLLLRGSRASPERTIKCFEEALALARRYASDEETGEQK